MIPRTTTALLALAAIACKTPEEKPDLLDTGWFDDTDSYDPEDCPHRVVDVQPAAGETEWYWQTPPQLWTGTDQVDRYSAQLIDPQGFEVASTPDWAAEGLSFSLPVGDGLQPNGIYTLKYTDCAGPHEHTFQTSALGAPLADGPGSLVGRTWQLDALNATWIEPGGFAALLQLYFTVPVLIGVEWADPSLLDLVGAPGEIDETGAVEQNRAEPTWDFPVTDFAGAPYFASVAETASFGYADVSVPIHDLEFTGTFSADGSWIGGGTLQGLGDTRDLGELFGQDDDPNAVCELAASLGVLCQPCPDSEPYCLFLRAVDVSSYELEGLTLTKQ